MSSEKLLPPIRGLAVSKPKRESWLLEELLDALLCIDSESRVDASRFRGVYILRSSREPREIAESIRFYKTQSAARVVLASRVLTEASRSSILEAVAGLISTHRPSSLRLLVNTRGSGSNVLSERDLRRLLEENSVEINSSSRIALVVESVDDVFILSLGTTGSCGFKCRLFTPL